MGTTLSPGLPSMPLGTTISLRLSILFCPLCEDVDADFSPGGLDGFGWLERLSRLLAVSSDDKDRMAGSWDAGGACARTLRVPRRTCRA